MNIEKTTVDLVEGQLELSNDFKEMSEELMLLLDAAEAVKTFIGLDKESMSEEDLSQATTALYDAVPKNIIEHVGGTDKAVGVFAEKAQGVISKFLGAKWEKFVKWYNNHDYGKMAQDLIAKIEAADELGGRMVPMYNASPVTHKKGSAYMPANKLASILDSFGNADKVFEKMLSDAVKAEGKSFKDFFPTAVKSIFKKVGKDRDGYWQLALETDSDFVMQALEAPGDKIINWKNEYWYYRERARKSHTSKEAISVLKSAGKLDGAITKFAKNVKSKWDKFPMDLESVDVMRVRNTLSFFTDFVLFAQATVTAVFKLYNATLKAPKASKGKENMELNVFDNSVYAEEIELTRAQEELEMLQEAEAAVDRYLEVNNGGWVRPELKAVAEAELYASVDRKLIEQFGDPVAAKKGIVGGIKDAIKRVIAALWEFMKKLIGVDFESRIDELISGFQTDKWVITTEEKRAGNLPTISAGTKNEAMQFVNFKVNVNAMMRSNADALLVKALKTQDLGEQAASQLCINLGKDIFPGLAQAPNKYSFNTTKRKDGNYWLDGTVSNGKITWRTIKPAKSALVKPVAVKVNDVYVLAKDLKDLWKLLERFEKAIGTASKTAKEMDAKAVSTIVGFSREIAKYNRQVCTDGYKYISAITEVNKRSNLDNAPA